jgi:tetratricopeptide (TPR) repeat protein
VSGRGQEPEAGRSQTTLAVALLLAITVAAVYASGLRMGFHFDDSHVIENNLALRRLTNVPRFFYDPTSSTASPDNRVLRPLLLTTFALNWAVSGAEPWSWHLVNIVLHWLVALLVFRIARDLLWLGRAAVPVATAAALIVALHPLNSSAVHYVSARSAILAALFYLAAFDAGARGRRAACVAFFIAALLTKEHVVTLPLALLGWFAVARLRGGGRPPWGLLATLAALAVAGLAWRAVLLPAGTLAATHASRQTPWTYCMTGWSAYLYYLRLFLWPDALVVDRVDYPMVQSFGELQAWGSLLALVVLGVLAWRVRHRAPALTFAALWVLVTLAAESTVFPLAEPVNEHRPYLAMLGLGTAAALGLWYGAGALAPRVRAPAAWAFALAVTFVATALGAATVARGAVWRSDYALWMDATRKAPRNLRAWTNAGHAALALGRLDEARRLLLEGHRLGPCYVYALLNLSALELRQGRPDASLAWVDEAVGCARTSALAHHYRAAALERLGRLDDALAAARRATSLDPSHADAWFLQAALLERRGAWADAAAAYDRVFALDPDRTDAAMAAGVIYHHRLGRSRLAVARYRAVLALDPHHYGAHYQLAVALLGAGERDAAVAAWRAFVPLARALRDRATLDGAPAALRAASPS